MTNDAILAAASSGQRAADIAKASGLPITVVHRVIHGRGFHARPSRARACRLCGTPTAFRGGPHALCDGCRAATQKAQSRATCAVRKAVAVGMLKPAKDRLCVDCGCAAFCYDHRDYSRPLIVEPVCRSCNALRGPAAMPKAA